MSRKRASPRAEQLIVDGRVAVNGTIIVELGSKADLDVDHIKVDGKLLRRPKNLVYLALYKPNNFVTTVDDPQGRDTVMDLLRGIKHRVYPVGRLDYHSEGLLLMTNDGDFANTITSAANHVKVTGTLTHDQEEAFRNGLPIEGRRTAPAGLKLIRRGENPWYEVRLIEGRKNQIRMMFKHCGVLVEKLKRVRIGDVTLGSLKPGEFRFLKGDEVARLIRGTKPRSTRPVALDKR